MRLNKGNFGGKKWMEKENIKYWNWKCENQSNFKLELQEDPKVSLDSYPVSLLHLSIFHAYGIIN